MEKKHYFFINQKFVTTKEFIDHKYTYYQINKLVNEGILKKLNKSVLENRLYEGEESDFYYAGAYVPSGVICLLSAAVYHGLSTYIPNCIEIAVDRKKVISTLPEWPLMELYYFSAARYKTGIEKIKEEKNSFQIYNVEKTVVDIIAYRNKVGIEETKEILNNYLKREDRNINKLYIYAKKLKCEKILRTYLEVLV